MPNSPKYLFLSHNSQDKPDVIKFAKSLEIHPLAVQQNLQVWLDKDDLHNQSEFPDQLINAIRIQTCAFALYLTDKKITPWIDTEITHAFKRHVDDQKEGKTYPLIPFYAHARENAVSLPLKLDPMNAIDNVFGDSDKIEYIIKQALGLDDSQVKPITSTIETINVNHKHSINYTLHQNQGLAHAKNTLGTSRALPIEELKKNEFGEAPLQVMSDFLLGDNKVWQQVNDLLGTNNPKRLRIMTDDAQLAMLPWQRLQDPATGKPLLTQGWSIEVSPIISNTDHLGFSEAKRVSNPLIVMPLEAGKKIGTSANRNIVQEYIHEYLGVVGNISVITTAYGIKQALTIDPPDLIYIYAPANNDEIQLDTDPTNPTFPQLLHVDKLAEWLAESSHRPIVILHLASKEREDYPKGLVDQCSLLWIQQQNRKPEQMISSFLKLLETLTSDAKGDIAQLISKQSLDLPLDCIPNIWIKNNTAKIVDTSTSGLSIGQLRAALLRVALGRKKLKNMLFGEISSSNNFGTKTCISLAVNGDKTACPYIFPAQLRQRLQWDDKENSLHVTNFDIYLKMTESTAPRDMMDDIQDANDNYILQGKDDIADILESRHKIRNQQTVIMFNWYVELQKVDDEQLENWIKALLRVIHQEFIRAIPDNAVMLCTLCFQTENEDQAQEAQDIADEAILSGETANIRAVTIETALGRIKSLELSQFLSKRERWYGDLKLEQASIDAKAYAKWVHKQTQGRFEETVITLWQQYQHDYQEYLSHE